ncbi:chromosome-partitioning protein ParB [Peptoclostridium acidaminophilum DSM 3953]|uniref:Chromosome-partitioning protein ParB n=1 Tax=Peptoclostridium acidaminophilum DSM 3953 TaxID=1286171 RepID=W8T9A4_PEPAC|nr:ParB/RepB/Spo0J family partition protein [Peptoclostridium acidaminophilum]AHM57500.1 chromosome-partitioning protein ParB [Peptoclostridium acidaminophilum DSM 3953]
MEKLGVMIPIDKITPNSNQPRRDFDNERLQSLSDSIKLHGLLQPIVVQKIGSKHVIVAGERRYRASLIAGAEHMPCIVLESSQQKKVMEMALVENIQRENLNPVEEALAYKALIEEYGTTQEEISKAVGKSRPYITNTLRLLNLPDQVLTLVRDGSISAGHAKAILRIEDKRLQAQTANDIIQKGLSVRAVEDIAKTLSKTKSKGLQSKSKADIFTEHLQERLVETLGTKVVIIQSKKKGKIEIEYYSEEELEKITSLILDK